jgi:NAD(P)H-dependent FMN reductase
LTNDAVHFLDLATIDLHEYANFLYSESEISDTLSHIQNDFIIPSSKFVFIVPEYNGGMPGILKLFIDAMSVRKVDATFNMKSACLTGVSSGRAGNLRGMEHLTGILNYLQVVVFPNRLPISSIHNFLNEDGDIEDPATEAAIKSQVMDFLAFRG